MPNYHFKCAGCKDVFDAIVSVGTQKTECPQCGKGNAKRVLTVPQVHFKGSGFYKTDSQMAKNPPKKPEAK